MTGPTELDRLDPAPRPSRPPRCHRGLQEQSVYRALRKLPAALRACPEAASALALARQLDETPMTPRDYAGHVRELRMCMAQLRALNPAGEAGDRTDEARQQVERNRGLYAVPDEGAS